MLSFGDSSFEDCRSDSAYVHESSYVDAPCRIGENTSILHFTHVMAHSVIGNHCHIGHNVTIGSGSLIGDHVRILNNSMLHSGVIIEDEVYCGPSTIFSALKNIRPQTTPISKVSPTLVKRGAHIGANTTVATGFTIGLYTFIEAGAVIDRNIPDFALVCGNPLKFSGWRCECGEKLKFSVAEELTHCKGCGKRYLQKSERKIVQLREGAQDLDSNTEPYPSIQLIKRQD
ncbi:MAG: N-acetyltransferase [Cyanobacteria bacterium]|nr:N-acetyltransferase [Cyanobacteriota bacterium]